MKSILQDEKACYITGRTDNLHKHHIFHGTRRKVSEEWGCWVWLTADRHNMSKYSVHHDNTLDYELKQKCQRRFEEIHGHDKFMQVFGKNYL